MLSVQVATNVIVSMSVVDRVRFRNGPLPPAPPLTCVNVQLGPPFNPNKSIKSTSPPNEVAPVGVPPVAPGPAPAAPGAAPAGAAPAGGGGGGPGECRAT